MQHISVFDIMKIGIGPSSSNTMGPWRASQRFLEERCADGTFADIQHIQFELFGSLAKTGLGHGTDIAVLMGLRGEDPATCDTLLIEVKVQQIRAEKKIWLLQQKCVPFDPAADLIFHFDKTLPYHPNGMRFTAVGAGAGVIEATYFSVGGGFVVKEGEGLEPSSITLPYPSECGEDVLVQCQEEDFPISQMVLENEKRWRGESEIRSGLLQLWGTMAESVYRGCHTTGLLPGGLKVQRRAPNMHRKLISEGARYGNHREWIKSIQDYRYNFQRIVKWVSCFALAARIAMEHHLGLTCDPVGGLVQVPCIERNAMGAMKAITAVNLALESSPQHAKVSLDAIISTMW